MAFGEREEENLTQSGSCEMDRKVRALSLSIFIHRLILLSIIIVLSNGKRRAFATSPTLNICTLVRIVRRDSFSASIELQVSLFSQLATANPCSMKCRSARPPSLVGQALQFSGLQLMKSVRSWYPPHS